MARSRPIMALATALALAGPATAADYRARLPQDEVIYFLLPDRFDNADPANDRGGLTGDRLVTGYDPTDKGFYHGGDLKGVTGGSTMSPRSARRRSGSLRCSATRRCRDRRARECRIPRLLDHRFRRMSTRTSAATPISRRWSMPPMRVAEGLHGHRRQSHRRRHPVPRMRGRRRAPIAAAPIIRTSAAAASPGRRSTPASLATTIARSPISPA